MVWTDLLIFLVIFSVIGVIVVIMYRRNMKVFDAMLETHKMVIEIRDLLIAEKKSS